MAMVVADRALAQEGWLCVAEQAAGMRYDRTAQEWVATPFRATGKHYVVRRADDDDVALWRELLQHPAVEFLWVVGEEGKRARYPCERDFRHGLLRCRIFGSIDFTINRDTLRYQSYYEGGWLSGRTGDEPDTDSPSITIGRCSPL
ncbi:hypothetical protein JYK14_08045 [Siccirubricoccus sp. KC 17139]|uniref:Uncharacterized protein n=1 Tax=Siccirubricoccus soli TaxID=2899147 RepID=A0ABT1D2I6_9PROT|nr:hypothetical protein [Siccirubricoccus soli]MCO6416116.1 hypothetical protein [Siccirubricoccus soli]MCP2682250.1 hypothetical protein [Siccirubricoccus soli]